MHSIPQENTYLVSFASRQYAKAQAKGQQATSLLLDVELWTQAGNTSSEAQKSPACKSIALPAEWFTFSRRGFRSPLMAWYRDCASPHPTGEPVIGVTCKSLWAYKYTNTNKSPILHLFVYHLDVHFFPWGS